MKLWFSGVCVCGLLGSPNSSAKYISYHGSVKNARTPRAWRSSCCAVARRQLLTPCSAFRSSNVINKKDKGFSRTGKAPHGSICNSFSVILNSTFPPLKNTSVESLLPMEAQGRWGQVGVSFWGAPPLMLQEPPVVWMFLCLSNHMLTKPWSTHHTAI